MMFPKVPLPIRFRAALAVLSLLALPLVAVSPVAAQGWAPAPGSVHVADVRAGLNVRAGPGKAYPRIGVLARGQGGQVAGCDAGGRWCALTFANGGQGWVYMPMTRPAGVPASLRAPVDWRRLYRTDVPYIHTGQGRVNLRQGAGTHRTVVAQLNTGGGGFVQGCSEDARWCLISVPPNGIEGWVYMDLLDPITAPAHAGGTLYHR